MRRLRNPLSTPEELQKKKILIEPKLVAALDDGATFAVMQKMAPLPTMLELIKARRYLQKVLWSLSVEELRNWSKTQSSMLMVDAVRGQRKKTV